MHFVSNIHITNYKSIVDEEFHLSAYTPLVGYNNAGKSNILEAIKWLISKSSLPETSFNNIGLPVEVSGTIEGITNAILSQLPTAQQSSIQPFIVNQTLKIRRKQNNPSQSTKEIKIDVWDSTQNQWVSNPNGIDNALKSLLPEPIEIGAMENAAEDASKFKTSTTIGKLIAEVMAPIEQSHSAEIAEALDQLKQKFDAEGDDRAEELTQFDSDTTAKLQDLFPGIQIKLHVPSPEIKEVFKSGTIRVYENDQGRDLTAYGHGTQRSVQMALVRHLAEVQRDQTNRVSNTLLLIDEPELYLHPQAVEQVRSALKSLSESGYQVLFTTHSPQMIPSEDIKHTLLIRKVLPRGTFARERLKSAVEQVAQDAISQFELLFSLENANQILFSEKVLFAEGKTEKRLLPYLYSEYHNITLGQNKIAFTSLDGSGSIAKSIRVLAVMDLPCKAIVDLDYAFKESIKNGFIDANNPAFVACKNKFTENPDILTSEDGLPKNNGDMTAAKAYGWLATQEDMQDHINELHDLLKANNIWLWKKGAIEEHLNLGAKNEQAWASLKSQIDQNGFDSVINDSDVIEMLDWISLNG